MFATKRWSTEFEPFAVPDMKPAPLFFSAVDQTHIIRSAPKAKPVASLFRAVQP